LGVALLAQEVVGDLGAAARGQARAGRPQGLEGVDGAGAHGTGFEAEEVGDLVVALALLEHELDDGALGGIERVDRGHGSAKVSSSAVETRSLTAIKGTFDALFGLEILEYSEEEVRGQVVIHPHHKQPAGLLHGGVLAAMAESLASLATFHAVAGDGKVA